MCSVTIPKSLIPLLHPIERMTYGPIFHPFTFLSALFHAHRNKKKDSNNLFVSGENSSIGQIAPFFPCFTIYICFSGLPFTRYCLQFQLPPSLWVTYKLWHWTKVPNTLLLIFNKRIHLFKLDKQGAYASEICLNRFKFTRILFIEGFFF